METLKSSFENVADWCEKHLEDQRGQEIGMTFGAMLRVYGRLATLPSRLHGEQRAARSRQLNAKAEELLLALSSRFLVAYGWVESMNRKVAEPLSMRTNMIYDSGPRPGG
jgi:hypothetical protein